MKSSNVYDREYGWVKRTSRTTNVICTSLSCGKKTRVHKNALSRRGGVTCKHCGAMTVVSAA